MNEQAATPTAPLTQLAPGKESLSPFEYNNARYTVRLGENVSLNDLMRPEYWAHHSKDLRPRDELVCYADDGAFRVELLVIDCARTWAKVQLLSSHDLTQKTQSGKASGIEIQAFLDEHEIKHRGPLKWGVLRRSDKSVLVEGLETKEGATAWLEKRAREQVGAPVKAAA